MGWRRPPELEIVKIVTQYNLKSQQGQWDGADRRNWKQCKISPYITKKNPSQRVGAARRNWK